MMLVSSGPPQSAEARLARVASVGCHILMFVAFEIGLLLSAQIPPDSTVLVANMDDDSVWLVDAVTGLRRGVV
jgi:hypothetical protein